MLYRLPSAGSFQSVNMNDHSVILDARRQSNKSMHDDDVAKSGVSLSRFTKKS